MSKTIPSGLATVYASGAATLAIGLRLTRSDGVVLGFTSADRDATISGVTYSPSRAIDSSSITSSDGLTVDNLEMTTTGWEDTFNRADVLAGRWSGAAFLLFRYSWADPTAGIEPLLAGVVGNMRPERGALVTELRGLQQYLQQPVGSVTSKTCRGRFADYPTPMGSNRCRLSAGAWTDSMAVATVTSRRACTVAAAGVSDPYWAQVAFLLAADGANGATAFTDLSPNGLTVTASGNAQISTASPKYGSGAALFDGSGDRLAATLPASLGTADLTIEFWARPVMGSSAAYCRFLMIGNNSQLGALYIARNNAANPATLIVDAHDGSAYQRIITGTLALANATWSHVMLTRASGTWRLFVNGALDGTSAFAGTGSNLSRTALYMGANDTLGESYAGQLDDVRITAGVARQTTAFTPPASAHPLPAVSRATGWYTEGVATWQTGANAGVISRVKLHSSGGAIELANDLPADIQVGDTLQLLAGCRKRLAEDCSARFSNVINFQGEPHLPGYDALTALPDTSA